MNDVEKMLELPRMQDLQEINRLNDRIEGLERQVEALKNYIREELGVDVVNINTTDTEVIVEIENPLTPKEMEQMEYHSKLLEKHSSMFNYGREKMAESL